MTETIDKTGLSAEEYADHLLGAGIAAFETLAAYVGGRLGWYQALHDHGPMTAAELAARTGTHERYCLEWLEMQAGFETLTASAEGDRHERRFTLPEGPAEVLTDVNSLNYLAGLPQMVGAVGPQLGHLLDAYRHGGGVSWDQLGDDARDSQGALNRPWFEHRLGPALSGVPEIDSVLGQDGATIADVGCGMGWSTIALARAYPKASVVGLDIDQPSVEAARENAAEAGVADRVTFRLAEGETLAGDRRFDAVFAFECLHDMPRPVEVLTAVRESVGESGLVVVMDEAVADEFEAPAGIVDRLMYGYSMFICLPDGMSSQPSEGTGTVMRREVLETYATRAGFSGVTVLPIEDFSFFRFYRLHP
jgi:SAM-dependent methyltransferase